MIESINRGSMVSILLKVLKKIEFVMGSMRNKQWPLGMIVKETELADNKERFTILVVDDDPSLVDVLVDLLAPRYRVRVALNGHEAIFKASITPHPDLILLDVIMPGKDGYETCTDLKKDERTQSIPIIFLTALTEERDETRGFRAGGVDFISKPISPAVVLERIKTHLALHDAYQQVWKQRDLLHMERCLIESILLRMRKKTGVPKENIRILTTPVEETTGDIILWGTKDNGILHILLGDFTGHGLPAAIGGPMVEDIFFSMTEKGYSGQEILWEMNRKLVEKLPASVFMAACFMELDGKSQTLKVQNAAMPDVLVMRHGHLYNRFPSTFFPLGICHASTCDYLFQETSLIPEDRVYVCSDGVIETINGAGDFFGEARLVDLLSRRPPGIDGLQWIKQALEHYRGNLPQVDDISILEMTV